MVNHPGQPITLKNIADLVGQAHQRAFTPKNIIKGFSKTGIYPFNSHIFSAADYLSSSVTDRPDPHEQFRSPESSENYSDLPNLKQQDQPCKSGLSPNLPQTFDELTYRPIPPEDISKTQEGIRPLPKAPSRKKRRSKT
jgi:hypothetical protein